MSVFGRPIDCPQTETTPLAPVTPYGVGKGLAQLAVKCARVTYGLPAAAVILYNHESPRRSTAFVTMKVANAVANIRMGNALRLALGNLAAKRDWGWAPDYVEGMWQLAQDECSEDVILSTGKLHSVEDLVRTAFEAVELDWRNHVDVDTSLVSVEEPAYCCGNPARVKSFMGWRTTVAFDALVQRLVTAELERMQS